MSESRFKSVKDVCNTVVGKIVIVVMSIVLAATFIPELLNARNDFAVILGVFSIVAIVVSLWVYQAKILLWLGFNGSDEI